MGRIGDDLIEGFEETPEDLRHPIMAEGIDTSLVLTRLARPEETAVLAEVVIGAFRVMRPAIEADQWDRLVGNIGAGLANTVDNTILGAWRNDRMVGGVAYSGPSAPRLGFADGWSYLRALGVDPEAGGRGVGRRLVEACVDLARADHAKAIGLYTADINQRARRLYARTGFQELPTSMTRYGLAYHAYVLRLARQQP